MLPSLELSSCTLRARTTDTIEKLLAVFQRCMAERWEAASVCSMPQVLPCPDAPACAQCLYCSSR